MVLGNVARAQVRLGLEIRVGPQTPAIPELGKGWEPVMEVQPRVQNKCL